MAYPYPVPPSVNQGFPPSAPQMYQGAYQGFQSNVPQNVGLEPEPWASMTDIITASQSLEDAIHACSYKSIQKDLKEAMKYLGYAKVYLTTAASAYPNQSSQFMNLANLVGQTISQLKMVAKGVPKKNFKSYQTGTIYAFQGNMSSLYKQVSAMQG